MRRQRDAFTLVELLVVIGIIGLLIAFLMPALNKAREQAVKAMCLSNLHQITLAVIGYANENKGAVPAPHTHSRPNCLNDPWAPGIGMPLNDLRLQFVKFIKDPHVYYCPANLDLFYKERPLDPVWGAGWFEGWDASGVNVDNFVGYAYWPQFVYDGVPGISTTWINPTEAPGAKLDSRRRILWTDLTQDVPLAPAGLRLGYIWWNHGRGGGSEPDNQPKDPTWAGRAYSDGSAIGSNKAEWQLRVQVGTGLNFYW